MNRREFMKLLLAAPAVKLLPKEVEPKSKSELHAVDGLPGVLAFHPMDNVKVLQPGDTIEYTNMGDVAVSTGLIVSTDSTPWTMDGGLFRHMMEDGRK